MCQVDVGKIILTMKGYEFRLYCWISAAAPAPYGLPPKLAASPRGKAQWAQFGRGAAMRLREMQLRERDICG